jgi:hypothetical protein
MLNLRLLLYRLVASFIASRVECDLQGLRVDAGGTPV